MLPEASAKIGRVGRPAYGLSIDTKIDDLELL